MEKEPVKIVYQVLKQQIEDGWKMDRLKEHYNLNHSQMKKVLQQTGLQIRKFRQPAFVIEGLEVGEPVIENIKTETINSEETQQVNNEFDDNAGEILEAQKEAEFMNMEPVSEEENVQKNFWE